MRPARAARRRTLVAAIGLAGLAAAAGCSSGPPEVTVSVGDQTVTVPASMYCENGGPVVSGEEQAVAPIRVAPGERVEIEVPDDVAKAGWDVQVWTATDESGPLLPSELITTVEVGENDSYDEITTSDAAPETYYLIVAKKPMKGCPDAGGLWPLGFIREA